ncbi:2180_t:CDS:2, partial [Racocetra persica]
MLTADNLRDKLNVKIVCYHYYKSRSPFNDTGDVVEDCNSKEVQSMASKFLAMLNLCSAIPAIFRAGPYGSLSDRRGRRIVLLLPTIGAVISTIINILVGTYYKSLSLYFLVVSPLIDGITGGFLPVKAAFYAYATDCTPIERRNIVFSRLQSAIFIGFAIGPLLGGIILKFTDNLLSGFYVNLTIYIAFCIFVIFILPESLSKETSDKNILQQKHMKDALKRKSKHFIWIWHIIDMFKPLLLFLPRKTRIQSDNNATIQQLSEARKTVTSIAFMGSQTLFFLYTAKKFSWTAVEQGYFFFMMG